MALEDELKARTLALVSQQMANWVVEIQKRIVEHQANLVGALDELQENVARYDEKIDEGSIGSAIDLVAAVTTHVPGDEVELTVLRDGDEVTVTVTLDESPY